jgi:hypothetical protein
LGLSGWCRRSWLQRCGFGFERLFFPEWRPFPRTATRIKDRGEYHLRLNRLSGKVHEHYSNHGPGQEPEA